MCNLPYVIDNKKKFLLENIELIKNNKEVIENKVLEDNIGCITREEIYHTILRQLRGAGAKILL